MVSWVSKCVVAGSVLGLGGLATGCEAAAPSSWSFFGDDGGDSNSAASGSGSGSSGGGGFDTDSGNTSSSGSPASGSGSGSGSSSSSSSGSNGGGGSTGGSSSGNGDGSSSSGAASGSSSGSSDPLAAARVQCVQIINTYRATLDPPSPPLMENTTSESCVDMQAQADSMANTAHSAFGMCQEFAQDECPGWPGPPSNIMTKCLADMWAEGPPPMGQDNHWLNMSNAQYTQVACGFYQTPAGDWWATQDFW
jgi:hypothetical protein